jgi:hypothetical protein
MLTAGEFGAAVGEQIANSLNAEVHSLLSVKDELETLIKQYDYIAVASWRPYVKLYRQIDQICFDNNIRWSVTDMNGQVLRCGPLVIPTQGTCYHCFYSREVSHLKAVQRSSIAEGNFERQDSMGLAGFIQPLVSIAASSLTEDSTADAKKASRFRFVDILASSVRESKVIGIHNCPRCRPKDDDADQSRRFVDGMIPTLGEILE